MRFYLQFLFQILLGGEEIYTVGGIKEELLDGRKGLNSLQAIRIWIRRRIRFYKDKKTKATAISSFRTYNNNVLQRLSKEEFDALKNQINLKTKKLSFKNLTNLIISYS